jgi:type IV pilus assembly protein PilQ
VDKPKADHKKAGENSVVTMNCSDFPAVVLRYLSLQTGVNMVLLTPPDAKIELNVKNVPFIEVVHHICALSGLEYLKVNQTYVLATADRLKSNYPKEWDVLHPEPPKPPVVPVQATVTQTYTSNYVSASQLSDVLSKLFSTDKLTVIVGPVSANPTMADQDTSSSTGVTTTVLAKDSATSDSGSRLLLLKGTPDDIKAALDVIKQLDVARSQVSIAVTIYDISNNALKDTGLSWTFSNVNVAEQNPKGLGLGSFSRAPESFSAALAALETHDQAKLLASPNISVLDGSRALILIGDRINYPVLIGYSQGNTPIFDKQTERVGIYLQVAASISTDGNITLSLYPQVSTISGFLNVNGASYPQVSTREAQTTLRVRSGETIVMGGMLKDDDILNTDAVPLLSKIPILGELFQHRKKTKQSSQVIITITPTVIPQKAQ